MIQNQVPRSVWRKLPYMKADLAITRSFEAHGHRISKTVHISEIGATMEGIYAVGQN